MKENEIWLKRIILPKALPNKKIVQLFNEAKQGNDSAKEILIIHNIKLVLYRVLNRFNNINYDKNDLISIGNIGLILSSETPIFLLSEICNISLRAIIHLHPPLLPQGNRRSLHSPHLLTHQQ